MNPTSARAVRIAILLPVLLLLALLGYFRFLGTEAFAKVVERALSQALRAEVSVEKHEVLGVLGVVLEGLEAEFRAGGPPSGLVWKAERAEATSRTPLVWGPYKVVLVTGSELRLDRLDVLPKLDVLLRRPGRPAVRRVRFEDAAVTFPVGDRRVRLAGVDLDIVLGGVTGVSVSLSDFKLEGVDSAVLEREAPSISFDVRIPGDRIQLIGLKASGRSGWRARGFLEVEFRDGGPHLRGRMELWGLRLLHIYKPPPGVEVPHGAKVERVVEFYGPARSLTFEVTTKIVGLSYKDRALGLAAHGVVLSKMKAAHRVDIVEVFERLLAGARERPRPAASVEGPLN